MKRPERPVGRLNHRGRDCLHSVPRTLSKLWKNEKSQIFLGECITWMMIRHWNNASLGRPVLWTTRPLDSASLERGVPWTTRPLDDPSLGRPVPWTTRPLDDPSHGRCASWTTHPLDGGSLELLGSFRIRPLIDASLTSVCTEISWIVSSFFLFTTYTVCGKNPKTIEIRGQLKKIWFYPVPKSHTQMGKRLVQKLRAKNSQAWAPLNKG
jgi:hypothetical protein